MSLFRARNFGTTSWTEIEVTPSEPDEPTPTDSLINARVAQALEDLSDIHVQVYTENGWEDLDGQT